jgi:hypothetical protein
MTPPDEIVKAIKLVAEGGAFKCAEVTAGDGESKATAYLVSAETLFAFKALLDQNVRTIALARQFASRAQEKRAKDKWFVKEAPRIIKLCTKTIVQTPTLDGIVHLK